MLIISYFCVMAFLKETAKNIESIFTEWSGESPAEINPLPGSGSIRSYFRVKGKSKKAIAAYNPDKKENESFIYLSHHFYSKGLNVPEIYAFRNELNLYLIEDLGDDILFDRILAEKNNLTSGTKELIKSSLRSLAELQLRGSRGIDFSKCYPRARFDAQSIQWDLEYFKYHFLKIFDIPFDEQKLENDFQSLKNMLLQAGHQYFMHRDFQSRNIMIKNNTPCFIDYQGGRKGPLQYDLVSFLFQVRAEFPWVFKMEMIDYYKQELSKWIKVSGKDFDHELFLLAYLRLMQVFGAYGYRGIIQNKNHFLMSIPFALKALEELRRKVELPGNLPEIRKIYNYMLHIQTGMPIQKMEPEKLQLSISSFSFKHGTPKDYTGNGGGYVFDCRALPNPGRIEKYKSFDGKDHAVIQYLQEFAEVETFIKKCHDLVNISIRNYLERGFKHLSVSFGCTGGQHRSVYCAEQLYRLLKKDSRLKLNIYHKELKD
ncbi:MAG: phosphotransferase [Bacteroidales bacterium]|nr:phosphotransferase [Bacteroidales bacterium]MCF8387832.1 phosphotransferase [Bacteroidales bacterium]MCF8396608.1 phosphotransferase [Bacteroidales bacterium]